MKTILLIVGAFWVGIPAFFWSWSHFLRLKNIKAAKNYCQENNLEFIRVKRYELHYRLYFAKGKTRAWCNYSTDRHNQLHWLKESPVEKIARRN